MTIDDGICENCLAKNHCDVLPYSNNCNEVRAMAKHDKQVYNKAIDDFAEKLSLAFDETIEEYGFYPENLIRQVAEQLKAEVAQNE